MMYEIIVGTVTGRVVREKVCGALDTVDRIAGLRECINITNIDVMDTMTGAIMMTIECDCVVWLDEDFTIAMVNETLANI